MSPQWAQAARLAAALLMSKPKAVLGRSVWKLCEELHRLPQSTQPASVRPRVPIRGAMGRAAVGGL